METLRHVRRRKVDSGHNFFLRVQRTQERKKERTRKRRKREKHEGKKKVEREKKTEKRKERKRKKEKERERERKNKKERETEKQRNRNRGGEKFFLRILRKPILRRQRLSENALLLYNLQLTTLQIIKEGKVRKKE